MKDVGLRIRVQRDLREQFLEVCRAQDKPAAQVLREFMRKYVAQHKLDWHSEEADQDNTAVAVPEMGGQYHSR
jgi:hypothetical protein